MAEREWTDDLEEMEEILDDLKVLLRGVREVDPEHAQKISGMILLKRI